MSFFITGTDTDVGKTYIACLLIRALRAVGVDAVGMKPICCGDRQDAEALVEASGGCVSINDVNPVWMRPAVAPYSASLIEGRNVDLDLIHEKFTELRKRHSVVIVEGAGGWMVPVTDTYSMADLAIEWQLPVIIVAANRLGVINHTQLTVRAVQADGLPCAGLVLNQAVPASEFDAAVATNRSVLEHLLKIPLLAEIKHGATDWPGPLPAYKPE